jgi:AraC-like DNA-binding protein
MAENHKNPLNSASNPSRTTRRRFSHSEKLRIVEAADRCTKPGELGLLLRREGLYSSHLVFVFGQAGVDGVCEFTQRLRQKINHRLTARFDMRRNDLNARTRAFV